MIHVASEENKHGLKVFANAQMEHQGDVISSDGCQLVSVSGRPQVLE